MIRVNAPAKLNLALEVVGRRPDGYHDLATVFQTISLCDHLTIAPAEGLSLEVSGDAPLSHDNIAMLAARAIGHLAPGRGASIHLTKRIPVAAGLGGGSSDAASVLCALNSLWGLQLERDALNALAASLGADVPFFLTGGTALALGRGDDVRPLPAPPPLWAVIATPPIRVPGKTASIFSALRSDEYSDGSRVQALAQAIESGRFAGPPPLHNSLMPAALRVFTNLRGFVAELEKHSPVQWTLSGAGPSLFSLHPDSDQALHTAASLRGLTGTVTVAQFCPATAPCCRPKSPPDQA